MVLGMLWRGLKSIGDCSITVYYCLQLLLLPSQHAGVVLSSISPGCHCPDPALQGFLCSNRNPVALVTKVPPGTELRLFVVWVSHSERSYIIIVISCSQAKDAVGSLSPMHEPPAPVKADALGGALR